MEMLHCAPEEFPSIDEQFWDLLFDDPDLLRAEFDALIAAAWSGAPPARPGRYLTRPDPNRRPRSGTADRHTGRPVRCRSVARSRQRSPPP